MNTPEAPASKPIEIIVHVGSATVPIAICPTCRNVFTQEIAVARRLASRCCDPRCDCGSPCPSYLSACEACLDRARADREARRFAEAAKLTPEAYGEGWVHLETRGLRESDYFRGADDVIDWCARNGRPRPAYVWACTSMAFSMDADSVIEAALDEHHEDARDHIDDAVGLQRLLDAWCATQDVVSYFVDHGRAVLVPPAPPVVDAATHAEGALDHGDDSVF